MKVLFIGGTGFISTAVSRMAVARGIELFHLNRGQRSSTIAGVAQITADVHDPQQLRASLDGRQFDVVVDWIAYGVADIERDLEAFRGRTRQFVFFSSASAYQ
jgi:nucleoside-diphosphate-sugar epimerase